MVLGQQQLKRWILLALFAYKDSPGTVSPLLEMAAMRGRFMELLVQKSENCSRDDADSAFMVGILSLIDILFAVSMEDVVKQLNLSEEAKSALLLRAGKLGELLQITEKIEKLDFRGAEPLMARLHVDANHLLDAQLNAINWTNRLTQTV
jgi:EAL and modified HD-GYP domain-containing signal transduction protein